MGSTLDWSKQVSRNPFCELILSAQNAYSVRRNRSVSGVPLVVQDSDPCGGLMSAQSIPSGPVQVSSVSTMQISVGTMEGVLVGARVGSVEGCNVGANVGSSVGAGVTKLLERVSTMKLFQKAMSSSGAAWRLGWESKRNSKLLASARSVVCLRFLRMGLELSVSVSLSATAPVKRSRAVATWDNKDLVLVILSSCCY